MMMWVVRQTITPCSLTKGLCIAHCLQTVTCSFSSITINIYGYPFPFARGLSPGGIFFTRRWTIFSCTVRIQRMHEKRRRVWSRNACGLCISFCYTADSSSSGCRLPRFLDCLCYAHDYIFFFQYQFACISINIHLLLGCVLKPLPV
jgi:hypothetical protein